MKRAWMCILMAAAIVGARGARAQTDSTPLSKVPAYRRRLLAAFDENSGDPISGVRVTDVLTGTSMVTSATGLVALIFVPEGPRLVRLQKLGYEVQTLPVTIVDTDTSGFTILMHRVTELPKVVTKDSAPVISSKFRGFEERRKTTHGYFMTEDQLRKADGKSLANALSSALPGMAIARSGGSALLMRSPRCTDATHSQPPQVYIDGTPIVQESSAVTSRKAKTSAQDTYDISQFTVEELAAVEWYPDNATLPMEFSHSAKTCGALFLWTRAR
jgi:hypothetical protein